MKQFHKRIKLYRYLRKYAANLSIEPLSKTNLREMIAGKNPLQPHQEEFVQWVNSTIPHNDNWRVWVVRHYKKKPEDFTPEIKSQIQHYVAMARVSPEVERVRFDKTHDLHTGFSMLEEAEREFHIKNAKKEGKVYPTPITKFFNKAATPNRAWFHLGTNNDRGEADAMGHCADTGNADSKLISLRDIVQDKGITYHIPRVTASVYEFPDGSFYIGQMKGPQNKKPSRAYHEDIMELLKNPKMIGLVGKEYNPAKDFKFSDLTPEQRAEVLKHNPHFVKNKTEAKLKGKEVAKAIHKDISKIKELGYGHISLFHDQLQPILQDHPNLFDDLEIVDRLYNTNDSRWRRFLAEHRQLFIQAPYLAEKLANDENYYVRSQIAQHQDLFTKAPHLAEKLANDKEYGIRCKIARHPDLFTKAPHIAEKLANDESEYVRYEIAQHPDLFTKFPHIVEKLANDVNDSVRIQIVRHPNLFTKFPHLVEKFANDTNAQIREKIADHLDLFTKFPHLVEKFANDVEEYIRYQIAKHPDLFTKFPHLVEKFANDENDKVRKQIAEHPDLFTKFPHLVEKLANDEFIEIRHKIVSHPDLFTKFPHLIEKLANSKHSDVRQQIATHPDLFTKFPHLVEKFANDESMDIRSKIASHPDLLTRFPYIAEKLANDEEYMVRKQIASHKDLLTKLPHLVEKFANDDVVVRGAIAKQPDLLTKFPHLVEKLANDLYYSIREAIAKHPNLLTKFPHLAENFANDKNLNVRAAIAKRPDLFTKAPHLVEKLANDEVRFVSNTLHDNARNQGINLDQFLQNLKNNNKKSEKLTINRYLLLKKAEYQFSKLSKNSESKEIVYVATDGDNIGASVERAALSNDLNAIKENDRIIRMGNDIIVNWAKMHEGVVYINGGDDVSFYMPKKYVKDLFKLKDEYTKATKFTLTIGVGDTISNALHALVYGKLNGKNQINIYSPTIKEALEKLQSKTDFSTQEKLKQEGLLKSYNKILKTYKAIQTVFCNSSNLRKDLISSIPVYAPVKELITLNDANKFLRPIVSKKPINASDIQFETYQFVDSKGIPYYVLVVKGLNGFIGDVFKSESKIQNHIFILNEKLFNLFKPFILQKTNLREMIAGKNPLQPHQEEFVQWVNSTIPNNDNWRVWLARHYKKKPEDFTPEIKSQIQHYVAMARVSPEVERVRFDKTHDLHTGFSMLKEAEKKYQQRLLGKERKIVPTKITKFFNKAATSNRAWFHLGTSKDSGEAKAMGHCADTHTEKSKLISLRDIVKEKGNTYHIPHVTASVYEFPDGSFYIGQMKGRHNEKPDPSFHKDIMELLKNPKMIGLLGLEYNPKKDFKFEELTPEQQQEVLKHNPYFIKNNEESEVKGKEIAEEINNDIGKIKELTHGHISLFRSTLYPILQGHPNLLDDPEVVQKLIDSKLSSVLVNHPDLFNKAPHVAEKLANDEDVDVRKQIAQHPDLFTKAPHLVEKLANDEDWRFRYQIAQHQDLFTKFPHLVEKLANDEDVDVRKQIAQHPNLFTKFPHLVEKFANDEDWSTRREIAKHPDLFTKAPHVVEKFANDKNSYVREEIAKHPDLLTKFPHLAEKLANDEDVDVRKQIAQHPDLFVKAPHIAEKLANDKIGDIRFEIAKRPDLFTKFPHLVEKLANDKDYSVRYQIAQHPDLFTKFPYLVEKLANDENSGVRDALDENAQKQGINLEQFIYDLKNNTQKSEKLTINRYLLLKKQTLFLNPNLKKRLYGKYK